MFVVFSRVVAVSANVLSSRKRRNTEVDISQREGKAESGNTYLLGGGSITYRQPPDKLDYTKILYYINNGQFKAGLTGD